MAGPPTPIGPGGPYYVPRNQLRNPFAEFWSNYLAVRNPKAMAVFQKRLGALDPRAQYDLLLAMEQQKTDLLEAQAENERSLRRAAVDQQLSDDEFARLAVQQDIAFAQAATQASIANAQQSTELTKAGALSDDGRAIANDLQSRVAEAQRYYVETGDRDEMIARIEEATANAQRDAAALSPMERTVGLPQAIQGLLSNQLITDPATQADVRAVIQPAFGAPASVPIRGAGTPRPASGEEINARAGAIAGRQIGARGSVGPVAAAAPSSPPSAATEPIPAPPPGSPVPAPRTPPGSPDPVGGAGVSAPASQDSIAAALDRLTEQQRRIRSEFAEDPFGGLGGFTEALPSSPEEIRAYIRRNPGRARGLGSGSAVRAPTDVAARSDATPRGEAAAPKRGKAARQADAFADSDLAKSMTGARIGTGGEFVPGKQSAEPPEPPKKTGAKKPKPIDLDALINEALPPQSEDRLGESSTEPDVSRGVASPAAPPASARAAGPVDSSDVYRTAGQAGSAARKRLTRQVGTALAESGAADAIGKSVEVGRAAAAVPLGVVSAVPAAAGSLGEKIGKAASERIRSLDPESFDRRRRRKRDEDEEPAESAP